MTGTIRKAVLPVGGLGTRFLPATKAIPKEMLPVVDKPLIQYGVEEARQAGIEEIIFVTSRGKAAIEDHFDHHFELMKTLEARGKKAELALAAAMQATAGKISYTRQPEAPGLGHAVWRSDEHTSELQTTNSIPYAVLRLPTTISYIPHTP